MTSSFLVINLTHTSPLRTAHHAPHSLLRLFWIMPYQPNWCYYKNVTHTLQSQGSFWHYYIGGNQIVFAAYGRIALKCVCTSITTSVCFKYFKITKFNHKLFLSLDRIVEKRYVHKFAISDAQHMRVLSILKAWNFTKKYFFDIVDKAKENW